MYTGILYATLSMLIIMSLLLYLFVRILTARSKASRKEILQDDMERLDNLPPPIQEIPATVTDLPQESEPEDPFMPSTLSTH